MFYKQPFKFPRWGLFSAFLLFSTCFIPQSFATPPLPHTATTWYVQYTPGDTNQAVQDWAYAKGAELGSIVNSIPGTQDHVVILAFGTPKLVNGKYGASTWYAGIHVDQIEVIAKKYAQGYYDGTGADVGSQLKLAIGTNNSNDFNAASAAHAQAWAKMVENVGTWLGAEKGSSVGKQVNVRGANDMEVGYNTPANTKVWVEAYKKELQGTTYFLYNFGDAQGCPRYGTSAVNGACSHGWTQEDLYQISKGSGFLYAIPEIYATAGGNARQWQQLSLYAHLKHGEKIWLKGPLTQMSACMQRGCSLTDNTPSQAWNQLWDRLNEDSRTAQDLTWSTDIRWRKY